MEETEQKEREVKEVKVPLKVEELKNFIENKNTFYHIKYSESDIKEGIFLNYLSNLDLPCEVLLHDCDFDAKEKLLVAYMTSKNIVDVQSLALNVAQVLLEYRGLNTEEIFVNPFFNKKEVKVFIKNNEEIVQRWEHFVESSLIYTLCITKDMEDEASNMKSQCPEIDDSSYVGLNIINLFLVPSFMELFFQQGTRTELSYFTRQFEEYMFKGSNLYEYFFSDANELFAMFLAQFSQEIDNKMIEDAMKESQQLEAN